MLIYVAGKYSSSNTIDVLNNIKTGIRVCAKIIKLGHTPFCPWLDYQFQFFEDLTIGDYYRYSADWLRVAETMLILPEWQDSMGTKLEIQLAQKLKIPTVYLGSGDINESVPNAISVLELMFQHMR